MSEVIESHGVKIASRLGALIDYAGMTMCGDCDQQRETIKDFYALRKAGDLEASLAKAQEMACALKGLLETNGEELCGDCFGSKQEVADAEAAIAALSAA